MKSLLPLFVFLTFFGCQTPEIPNGYASERLKVVRITDHIFQHISYLDIPDYGPFPCNGMVVIDDGEAIVFDTPTNDAASAELIVWITQTHGATVKAVVANHFHVDCVGGLAAFHEAGIPSYANASTLELAAELHDPVPNHSFNGHLALNAGSVVTSTVFVGEAHTSDNTVTYVPDDSTLFGGCMVKSMNAGKGNLADANLEAWPQTIEFVTFLHPDVKHVIPGHGDPGGKELLEYTKELMGGE